MCFGFGVEVSVAASSHLMKTNARLSSRLTVSLCWVTLDVRRRQSREARSRKKKKQQLPDSHLPCASAATLETERERESRGIHPVHSSSTCRDCSTDSWCALLMTHQSCVCTAVCPQTVFEGVKAAKKKSDITCTNRTRFYEALAFVDGAICSTAHSNQFIGVCFHVFPLAIIPSQILFGQASRNLGQHMY